MGVLSSCEGLCKHALNSISGLIDSSASVPHESCPWLPPKSKDRCLGVPVVRQFWKCRCLVVAKSTFAADCEVNPAPTLGTASGKPRIIPPGSDQGIMDGGAVASQLKINALQTLLAPLMGTGGFGVNHVWGHLPFLPSLAIN